MIISGGVNIYPAEIEGVLQSTTPPSADVAVFGVPDDEFGEQVKAVVQLADGVAADRRAGRRADGPLPRAPRRVQGAPLDRLRRRTAATPTGKLYKRLLRDPYWQAGSRRI